MIIIWPDPIMMVLVPDRFGTYPLGSRSLWFLPSLYWIQTLRFCSDNLSSSSEATSLGYNISSLDVTKHSQAHHPHRPRTFGTRNMAATRSNIPMPTHNNRKRRVEEDPWWVQLIAAILKPIIIFIGIAFVIYSITLIPWAAL